MTTALIAGVSDFLAYKCKLIDGNGITVAGQSHSIGQKSSAEQCGQDCAGLIKIFNKIQGAEYSSSSKQCICYENIEEVERRRNFKSCFLVPELEGTDRKSKRLFPFFFLLVLRLKS